MFGWIRKIEDIYITVGRIWEYVREVHCKLFQKPKKCTCSTSCCIDECDGEEEYSLSDVQSSLNGIQDSVEILETEIPRLSGLINPEKVLERYDERLAKVEVMLNEFKGCISMARASLEDKKEMQVLAKDIHVIAERMANHYKYAKSLNDQHFKINYIYDYLEKFIDGKGEKTKIEKKKPVKKPKSDI